MIWLLLVPAILVYFVIGGCVSAAIAKYSIEVDQPDGVDRVFMCFFAFVWPVVVIVALVLIAVALPVRIGEFIFFGKRTK